MSASPTVPTVGPVPDDYTGPAAQWLSTADTAKLIRDALKATFPGVKISVRSSNYSGGSSINVRWTDGPRLAQVEVVAEQYAGASFDGMTDMKSHRGDVLVTDAKGAARAVRLGADFVFRTRDHSPELLASLAPVAAEMLGEPVDPDRWYTGNYHHAGKFWPPHGNSASGAELLRWLGENAEPTDVPAEPAPTPVAQVVAAPVPAVTGVDVDGVRVAVTTRIDLTAPPATFDEGNNHPCCGEHFADPHAPDCPNNDVEPVTSTPGRGLAADLPSVGCKPVPSVNRSPMFVLTDAEYVAAGAVTLEDGRWIGRDTTGRELFNRKDMSGAQAAAERIGCLYVSSAWYGVGTYSTPEAINDAEPAPVRMARRAAEIAATTAASAASWTPHQVPTEPGLDAHPSEVGPAEGGPYGAPADWYTPTLDSDPDADLVISHDHADGTILHGGGKGDGTLEIVGGHRFDWRRGSGVHIPHSRDRFADLSSIDAAAKALRTAGWTVAVEIDDRWRPAAEREADRGERVERRTGRLTERAGLAAGRSDAAHERARSIGDSIPLGQPILVGHHSQRRAERDRDRIDAGMRKAIGEGKYADHLATRASGAASNEAAKHNPRAIMRRIGTLEAEARSWARELNDPATGPGRRRRATLELEKVTEDVAYQRAKLADHADAGTFVAWSADSVAKGDRVNVSGRWCEVARLNRKGVSVFGRWEWSTRSDRAEPVTWGDIHGLRRDGMQWNTPNGAPWPVVDAQRVARWRALRHSAGLPSNRYAEESARVGYAQRIAHGLPITAADAELEAFPAPADVQGRRALALLSLNIFDRLTAGERVPDVVADVAPFGGDAPAWRMPDGPTVDRRVDQLTPGDIVVGYYDRGSGRNLVRSFCGPVAHVGPLVDRRESGQWRTVTLASGPDGTVEREFQTHLWFAVHPASGDNGPEPSEPDAQDTPAPVPAAPDAGQPTVGGDVPQGAALTAIVAHIRARAADGLPVDPAGKLRVRRAEHGWTFDVPTLGGASRAGVAYADPGRPGKVLVSLT